MKLYYFPGASSLAPHIVAREGGIPVELVKVDIYGGHRTEAGEDYRAINPRGYVPALRFDDGSVHTEAAVLVQFLGDSAADGGLMPAAGTPERLRVQEWLNYVATELHRTFSPWLFQKDTADSTRDAVKPKLDERFAELDTVLAGREYLTGATFTVADAYLFTIVNWSNVVGISLASFPELLAFMTRVAARPKVREALVAEGLTT
ncbi:glutathione transferase GstA [Tabrizicola sp.]|uniref:glutathione transferase GstA n=1 Tax=Tabrizicola sp. TaxID=2005166 RepID=UPI003F3A9DE8